MRAVLFVTFLAACSSNHNNNNAPADMAQSPSLADLSTAGNPDLEPACNATPMTHAELINACTPADSVDKMPFYPTLAPNGQLPPLP
jgi:hypothetical protein